MVTFSVVTFTVTTIGSQTPRSPQTKLSAKTAVQTVTQQEGRGLAVVVGRIRKDPVFNGVKYVALAHNTIRGAAGCPVSLIAESMKSQGYL